MVEQLTVSRAKATTSNGRRTNSADRVRQVTRAVGRGLGTRQFMKAIKDFTPEELGRLTDELTAYYAYKFR